MHSPVSFGSRIRIVNRDAFHQGLRPSMGEVTEWEDRDHGVFREGFSKGLIMCNGGGVQNSREVALFHFVDNGNLKQQYSKLHKAVVQLKEAGQSLRGILLGGAPRWELSPKVRDMLIGLFEEMRIPYSMIWGHLDISSTTDFAYDPSEDTWQVHTSGIPVQRERSNKEYKSVETLAELKEAFQTVRLDPGDELWFGPERVDADSLKNA